MTRYDKKIINEIELNNPETKYVLRVVNTFRRTKLHVYDYRR